MAGIDIAYKVALGALSTLSVALKVTEEIHDHFFVEPRVRKEAANIEQLGMKELDANSSLSPAEQRSDGNAQLTDALDALRLQPSEFSMVIDQMTRDASSNKHLPTISLGEYGDPGILGYLALAKGPADATVHPGKRLVFPLSAYAYTVFSKAVPTETQTTLIPERYIPAKSVIFSKKD